MRTRWRWVAAAALSLIVTLAFTLPYASSNQATYLLDPLQRAMPELFRRDWFVSETPPYLPVFGWLAQWLFVLDPDGVVAVLTAHVVITVASYLAIFWLLRVLDGDLCALVVVAAWATVTKTMSMGGHYVFAGYLQPSSLSTLGWIVALAAFVEGRYLIAGVAAAAGGALHANFLVLGVGLFALAALARGGVGRRDFAKLLVPQLVVLACFAPSLLAAAGPSDEAVRILIEVHAPGHYSPERLVHWCPNIVAWQIGAYAALQLLSDRKTATVLWRFSLVVAAITIGSALVIQFSAFEALTQVRWARMAPFGQLACLVLIAIALGRQATSPVPLSQLQRWLIALGLSTPIVTTGAYLLIGWPLVVTGVILVFVVMLAPWQQLARAAAVALTAIVAAYSLWKSPRGSGVTTVVHAWPAERALSQWARAHTDVDALFVAPPALGRFRLLARRAVIADTKSPPLRPDLLVAWYHRLCNMVRLPGARTSQEIEARYEQLTLDELLVVAHEYGADYIVVTANAPPSPEPAVFANERFRVYRVAR